MISTGQGRGNAYMIYKYQARDEIWKELFVSFGTEKSKIHFVANKYSPFTWHLPSTFRLSFPLEHSILHLLFLSICVAFG